MHSVVPDMMVPINGADIKRQFSSGEFLDGGTMDYIIDEMKTTSELYDTGERVLLSQGFIMVCIAVNNVCCTVTLIIFYTCLLYTSPSPRDRG